MPKNKLQLIDDVLSPDFKIEDCRTLEEKEENMCTTLVRNKCNSIVFQLDKKLDKAYKGGLFPFFNKKKGVCSVCDYIIFAERRSELYALVIELKKGRRNKTLPQIKAGECFVDYVMATVNRIHSTNHTIRQRRISIKHFNPKRTTKYKGITYDENDHYIHCDKDKMHLVRFLK